MRTKERNGLEFVAEERVPADFFEEFVDEMEEEDIEDIKKQMSRYDVTTEWMLYIKELEDTLDDVLFLETKGTIKELDKIWRRLVEEYLDQDEDS